MKSTDKPWVGLGFEECGFDEAPKGRDGYAIDWRFDGFDLCDEDSNVPPPRIYLRPSPLVGLELALDIIDAQPGTEEAREIANLIRDEIKKHKST